MKKEEKPRNYVAKNAHKFYQDHVFPVKTKYERKQKHKRNYRDDS